MSCASTMKVAVVASTSSLVRCSSRFGSDRRRCHGRLLFARDTAAPARSSRPAAPFRPASADNPALPAGTPPPRTDRRPWRGRNTAACTSFSRSWRMTPIPSRPGICTSRKTRSGSSFWISSTASSHCVPVADNLDFGKVLAADRPVLHGRAVVVHDERGDRSSLSRGCAWNVSITVSALRIARPVTRSDVSPWRTCSQFSFRRRRVCPNKTTSRLRPPTESSAF